MSHQFTPAERFSILNNLANITRTASRVAKTLSQSSGINSNRDQLAIEIQNIRDQLELMESENNIPRYQSCNEPKIVGMAIVPPNTLAQATGPHAGNTFCECDFCVQARKDRETARRSSEDLPFINENPSPGT